MFDDKPYSVRIKVDVYDGGKITNYADHAVTEIEIAPKKNVIEGSTPLQFPKGAIHNIRLAVLMGKVKYPKYDKSSMSLYQKEI